ncbi:MAG: sigma-70 family RNA polymerase sigma factor [Rhodospirillaceae bacterium]|nr:sigma-70 family RNA polymerase sigma factor [Rhodospirillaceae bacterium]MCY4239413.1 sigma-70 family RNA polymerase sigma factor [Rhodospirillaceae bacterium]
MSVVSRSPVRFLSEEEERNILKRWTRHRDSTALDRLIDSHRPLVLKLATRYRTGALSLADLVQEGFVGLMEAANRFDTDREVRFATYAQWWIRSTMQEFVLRNMSAVRSVTSSRQKSLMFTLRKMADDPETPPPDAETKAELAQRFGVSLAAVDRMSMRMNAFDQSLDAVIGPSGDLVLKDLIADEGPTPEDTLMETDERLQKRAWLKSALANLPDRERRIIEGRHLGDGKLLLRELGDEMGVSKERVRQLEARAMETLQKTAKCDLAAGGLLRSTASTKRIVPVNRTGCPGQLV